MLSHSAYAEGDGATPQTDTLAVEATEQPTTEPQSITPETLWEQAAAAYNNANYDQAIEAYMAILSQGLQSHHTRFDHPYILFQFVTV